MPFKDDRLRMQREQDGTYSVQLPGIWVEHNYPTASAAMFAAECVLTKGLKTHCEAQSEELKVLQKQRSDIEASLSTVKSKIAKLELEIESRAPGKDIIAVIDGGYDAVQHYDLDNRYTRKYGPPINVFVTPWDKDRDGLVELGEFVVCYGWSRFHMPD